MENDATQKLSPVKEVLTEEQQALVNDALRFTAENLRKDGKAVYVITGDAGTGKSLVLNHLFYRIQSQRTDKDSLFYHTDNYFLVNHPEILKVYRSIAGKFHELLKKNYIRPTSFINHFGKTGKTADVVVIDETHLLLSKPDHYNNFYGDNQLQSIIDLARVVILVYDPNQVIKTKSYWDEGRLRAIVSKYTNHTFHLNGQFRMLCGKGLVHWINAFTEEQVLLPSPDDIADGYDFRIFRDAEDMYEEIRRRDRECGLSRITATINYPSVLDGGKHYVTEGRFRLPWDQYNFTSTPWAEIPSTLNEVGSIYTVQGFDLNYIGIILGPSVLLDKDNRIRIDLSKVTDVEIFKKRADITSTEAFEAVKLRLFLNALNVLMKRGRYGLYLYAHDKALSKALLDIQQKQQDKHRNHNGNR